MRYRYRLFLEREFWATRRWLGLSLHRMFWWVGAEYEQIRVVWQRDGQWLTVAGLGFAGLLAAVLLMVAQSEGLRDHPVDTTWVTFPSRMTLAATSGRPVLNSAMGERELELHAATYPAEFQFRNLVVQRVEPPTPAPVRPVMNEDDGNYKPLSPLVPTTPVAQPAPPIEPAPAPERGLEMVVEWLKSSPPAQWLAEMDRDRFSTSGGGSVAAETLQALLRAVQDGWKGAVAATDLASMTSNTPAIAYTGDAAASMTPSPDAPSSPLNDRPSGDTPDPTLPSRREVGMTVRVFDPQQARTETTGQSRISVRNDSDALLPVVEVTEPFERMPVVTSAQPGGVVQAGGIRRELLALAPGDEHSLSLQWRPQSPGSNRHDASVTASASVSASTIIQPARKDARLALSITNGSRLTVGETNKVQIRVRNVGEVNLKDVRILADLSPELIHHFGRTIEYLVGPLAVNQEHSTFLILEGAVAGGGRAILRAVAPETQTEMKEADYVITAAMDTPIAPGPTGPGRTDPLGNSPSIDFDNPVLSPQPGGFPGGSSLPPEAIPADPGNSRPSDTRPIPARDRGASTRERDKPGDGWSPIRQLSGQRRGSAGSGATSLASPLGNVAPADFVPIPARNPIPPGNDGGFPVTPFDPGSSLKPVPGSGNTPDELPVDPGTSGTIPDGSRSTTSPDPLLPMPPTVPRF